MSEVQRRFQFVVDREVSSDLRRCRLEDRDAFEEIIVLLQELEGALLLCENLIDEHYSDNEIESVQPFWELQKERLNVYRIKLYGVGRWRILTAGDHQAR